MSYGSAKMHILLTLLKKNALDTLNLMSLTHFSPMFHSYTPWKRQKNFGFLTISGGQEMEHWA